ncbi:MAG: hypothetical protein J07HX5_01784 [halophilic archaeon J07HX5]|jgi:hypothetical protein|nr:MAG: hypothetical protein J07HX5_01784 [halophilic archaeon J07HX5]
MTEDHKHKMKSYQRKQLLERIERDGATVGESIPDQIEIQGETVDLKTFVFEIRRRETIPTGDRDRVKRATRNLRRERLERKQRIEDADTPISYEDGERLADAIVGIDRALGALESLEPVDLEREAQAKETADRKRWTRFLQQALGQTDNSR